MVADTVHASGWVHLLTGFGGPVVALDGGANLHPYQSKRDLAACTRGDFASKAVVSFRDHGRQHRHVVHQENDYDEAERIDCAVNWWTRPLAVGSWQGERCVNMYMWMC